MRIRRLSSSLAFFALLAASPLIAQGRGGAPPPDTTAIRQTPTGYLFNFDNQNLETILQALADAAGVGLLTNRIPVQRASVHNPTPWTPVQILGYLRDEAESYGLKIYGDSVGTAAIRIEGPAPPAPALTAAQLLQQQIAQAQLVLHVYRLKHVNATQLAPVLQNLFTGTGAAGGGAAGVPGAAGVANNALAGIGAGAGPGGGGGGGGRGGGRGGGGGGANGGGGFGGAAGGANGAGGAAANNAVGGGANGGGGRGGGANGAATPAQIGQIASAFTATTQLIRIVAEETSNSLLIRATESDYQLVKSVIDGVDLRPLQVVIEVAIVELTKTKDLTLGVSGTFNNVPKSANGTVATSTNPSQVQAGDLDFIQSIAKGGGTINFNVALNALSNLGDVRISSLPVIIAENNRQAILNVGQQRPFVEVSQSVTVGTTGTVQTIQYLSVGTTLTITPTIDPDGYVDLQVAQTDDDATNDVEFSAPVLDQRSATTQVFVKDGQTTVLGGLADHTVTHTLTGIPILSSLPWIGGLFRNTEDDDQVDELFLFLTPHVIFTDQDLDAMEKAVKNGQGLGSDMLEKANVGPFFPPATDSLGRPVPQLRPPVKDTLPKKPPTSDSPLLTPSVQKPSAGDSMFLAPTPVPATPKPPRDSTTFDRRPLYSFNRALERSEGFVG